MAMRIVYTSVNKIAARKNEYFLNLIILDVYLLFGLLYLRLTAIIIINYLFEKYILFYGASPLLCHNYLLL